MQTLERHGEAESMSIRYAIGSGEHAFGYLAQIGDHLFQSPVSYYSRRRQWDMAPGYEQDPAPDFSRPVTAECLACHSGGPRLVPETLNSYRAPPIVALGITCERCHGNTKDHVSNPVGKNILDTPVYWWDDACGAWSLLELLQVFAEDYILVGRIFQFWEGLSENQSDDLLTPIDTDGYQKSLEDLAQRCKGLELPTSLILVGASALLLKAGGFSYRQACTKMAQIRECLEAEISTRVFLFVPPNRAPYLVFYDTGPTGKKDQPVLGDELRHFSPVLAKFPSCGFDLEEAGCCFAAGRFTACVHHLSRLVEFGLVSLADFAGVEKRHQRNWNTALNHAHNNLRDKKAGFSSTVSQSRDETYFSEAIGLLRNFNTAWRNPSSHAPEIFLEQKARTLFSITLATMDHLSRQLKEVPMPIED